MNSILKLKIAVIIFFFIIIFPDKLLLPNGVVIILSFIENFFTIFYEKVDLYFFMSTLAFISVFLFFKKSKKFMFFSFFLQLLWLIYKFEIRSLYYWYYLIPTIIYLTLFILLIYRTLKRKENNYKL